MKESVLLMLAEYITDLDVREPTLSFWDKGRYSQWSAKMWAAREIKSLVENCDNVIFAVENFASKMDRYSCMGGERGRSAFSAAYDVSMDILDIIYTLM